MEQTPLAKRILAWAVLVLAAIVALKVVAWVFFGLLQALFMIALLAAVVLGALWALRHV